jgi:hypothetical protein
VQYLRIFKINKIGEISNLKTTIFYLFLTALLLFLGFFCLETVPPLWWDEGWTLQVARNWVEVGHYGRIIDGQPTSARLSASFPVVAPAALSFNIFGVGIWQGRLPGVMISIITLGMLYGITSHLYSRHIAVGAIGVLLLLPLSPNVHVVLISRQVLGEMHSFFFLLAGYAFFYSSLRKSTWFLIPTILLWGVALMTKAQVPPFWFASLVVPLLLSYLKGWRRVSGLLLIALFGSSAIYLFYSWVLGYFLSAITVSEEAASGLRQMIAFVPILDLRLSAIREGVILAFPTLLGLVFGFRCLYQDLRSGEYEKSKYVLRVMLFSLALSWYLWFLLLANPFGRYMFTPVFIGSIFTSALLYHMTAGFSLSYLVKNASALLFKRQFDRMSVGAMVTIVLLVVAVFMTIFALIIFINLARISPVQDVVAYLEQNVEDGALIETYESELIFLSNHRFHFPPTQISFDLIRRKTIDPLTPINYDPLTADPDYLVIGSYSHFWGIYDDIRSSQDFILLKSFPRYLVYQRVR